MAKKKAAKKAVKGGRIAGQGMNWIRIDRRMALYARDGHNCAYCEAGGGPHGYGLTLDHLVPSSAGGRNEEHNLVTCCLRCNSERQDTPLKKWINGALAERGHDPAEVHARIKTLIKTPTDRDLGKKLVEARKQVPPPAPHELRAVAAAHVEAQRAHEEKVLKKKIKGPAKMSASADRPKAAIQTGKKGGKFVMTKSGKKVYVGKKAAGAR